MKAFCLAGPTGVGKSRFAVQLAKKVGGAVFSVDSVQVYRGMNIGTAKPTFEEQEGVLHYLIDLVDISQSFDLVQFVDAAERAVQNAVERGLVPIFCGGTGFYFQGLTKGLPATPPANAELRDQLQGKSSEELFKRLSELDPKYASTLHKNNRQRVIRALEILEETKGSVLDIPLKKREGILSDLTFYNYFFFEPREQLYSKLNSRTVGMYKQGLVEEVQHLSILGLEKNPQAAKAIMYQQTLSYLKGDLTWEEMIESAQKANRSYAKRQWTWFRKQQDFLPVCCQGLSEEKRLDLLLRRFEE